MRRSGERLEVGDRVDLARHDAPGVVIEVLARDVERVFRDGRLEVEEVNRYRVLLACGRRLVVNDRTRGIARVPDPVQPPPPAFHQLVLRRGDATSAS
jgi:hypothetical protein